METIGYLLASITFIWLWDNKVREKLFFEPLEDGEIKKEYRIKLFRVIDTAPIIGELLNCSTCISFWTGLTLFIITGNIFFVSLPLYYKLLTNQLK
jgi:hypothetical protein